MSMLSKLVAWIVLFATLTNHTVLASEPIEVATGAYYNTNAYPSVGLLEDERLLCVYSIRTTDKPRKFCVAGSFSSDHGLSWSDPVVLINTPGANDYDPGLMIIGSRVIVTSTTTPMDSGSQITTSRTIAISSGDGCASWSPPYDIPMGRRYTSGKVNNGIVLENGTAIFGYTWEDNLESMGALPGEGDMEEVSAVMMSYDGGRTWASGDGVGLDQRKPDNRPHAINGLCEPALAECSDGSVYMLCRTGLEKIYELRSRDGGRTWSEPQASALTGHNAPAALCGFRSRHGEGMFVVWNNSPEHRWPLCVSASYDNGATWSAPITIANIPGQQSSYPGCIQAADGTIIVVYQQQLADGGRNILAARINPDDLSQKN